MKREHVFLRQYFTIRPVNSPETSAAAYMPLMIVSRVMAFVRTLLVARILGDAGQAAFGLYQPALELINPLVALVMFGAADVAERYVSQVLREQGSAGLRQWLSVKFLRVGAAGLVALAGLAGLSPWLSSAVWGERQSVLLVMCGAAVFLVALYQLVGAELRGLRAFGAAAGMEAAGAMLLLVLSAGAAPLRDSRVLVAAYALSVAIPLAVYAALLWRFLTPGAAESATGTPGVFPRMNRFAAWALVRLLLVMLFGFLSLWGVRYLADAVRVDRAGLSAQTVAQYAMPYRIAQLLGFVAVTLWASCYGIAARAWSHGRSRRARMELFRIGRLGTAGVTLVAVTMLLARGVFAWILPTYAQAIETLLPGLLAVFIWYSLVAFFSTLADLSERPWQGAALWGMAVLGQLVGIAAGRWGWISTDDPRQVMLHSSAAGLLAALALVAPLTVCRPVRFTATGVPLAVLAIASVTLLSPSWVVDWIATPVLCGAVAFLFVSGLLLRRGDLRALRRGGLLGSPQRL